MIPSEGGSQHTVDRSESRADEDPADGKSVAHSFCDSNQIGAYAGVLVCEKFSGSTISRLYFIENENDLILGTYISKFFQKLCVGYLYSSYTLYAFDNNGADISLRNFFFPSFDFFEGKKATSKVSLMGATILGLSVTFTAAEVLP